MTECKAKAVLEGAKAVLEGTKAVLEGAKAVLEGAIQSGTTTKTAKSYTCTQLREPDGGGRGWQIPP